MCRVLDVSIVSWNPPAELMKVRLEMKMFLARHGRIDPFAWEGRDVNELRDHHAALIEIMKRESSMQRVQEDQ